MRQPWLTQLSRTGTTLPAGSLTILSSSHIGLQSGQKYHRQKNSHRAGVKEPADEGVKVHDQVRYREYLTRSLPRKLTSGFFGHPLEWLAVSPICSDWIVFKDFDHGSHGAVVRRQRCVQDGEVRPTVRSLSVHLHVALAYPL